MKGPLLYILGAGPGKSEYLTIKGLRILSLADVVLYDRLTSEDILSHVKKEAQLVYVGKHEGQQEEIQNYIFKQLLSHLEQSKVVVRLKGGDPFIFGRGFEEKNFVEGHGYKVEVVPGISSATGIASFAGIPLTHRELSSGFAVVTGHLCNDNSLVYKDYVNIPTIVVLMGVKNRKEIASGFIDAGRKKNEKIAFIQDGLLDKQRIVFSTLEKVAEGQLEIESPAVFIIGDTLNLINDDKFRET